MVRPGPALTHRQEWERQGPRSGLVLHFTHHQEWERQSPQSGLVLMWQEGRRDLHSGSQGSLCKAVAGGLDFTLSAHSGLSF